MIALLHHLIQHSAKIYPDNPALFHKQARLTYRQLNQEIIYLGTSLLNLGIAPGKRIAIFLPKRIESVVSFFAASYSGAVFVPINPLLKPEQVSHILRNCNAQILISSHERLNQLQEHLDNCKEIADIIDVNNKFSCKEKKHYNIHYYNSLQPVSPVPPASRIDADMCAILYTSGSTGKPKGVVLSHRNLITGATSVTEYLNNAPEDRLLAVLPFSFDYGLNQVTTALSIGASITLFDYLLPKDVIRAIEKHKITGLAGVPSLWNQLAPLNWGKAPKTLRYITSSGGIMPSSTLRCLRKSLPTTAPYLMYGLTEAFRSTYLPPEEIDSHPNSIGKAIPNAEIMVVRNDGSLCSPGEPGELVHRGSLVSLGYWNAPEKTAEHFKPAPTKEKALPLAEIAVWSGDIVKMDKQGFLYFIERKGEMIKTSGYRVSPTEVEEIIYSTNLSSEVAVLGVPHPTIGQAIIAAAVTEQASVESILTECKKQLPNFMVPLRIEVLTSLPKNPNGKIDRATLHQTYNDLFQESST